MEAIVQCPLCGRADPEALYAAEDHVSGQRFGLVRCRACGLVWTNPRPSGPELARYYPASYYGPAGRRFGFGLERLVRQFRRHAADRISRQVAGPGCILEVGSGRGTLLAEMARRGWQAVGTEFAASLSGAAVDTLGITVYATPRLNDCGFPDTAFDVIVLQHVLEHLAAPLETLVEVRRLARPGALLLITVPNFDGWVSGWTGKNCFALDVPRHLFHFSPQTLTRAIEQNGFRIFRRKSLSLEQDLFGFAQSLLNSSGAPFNVFYDLIRSSDARLRYTGGTGVGTFQVALYMLAGLALSGVGLPVSLAAAAAGRGGTLEYWARRA
jgi:SAM-dependent methyltransferase